MFSSTLKQEWFGNVRGDILSGIVVALALIPEAIAFSIIAGVDPMVGLYASFCIAVVIAFVGGRPGMISAATGAMALLMVTLVAEHGLEYLLATTILTGVLQIILGVFKLARFMKFIPKSVMVGFVNALAILIFTSQLQHFEGEGWIIYVLVGATLAIIYLFPLINKTVPSTLVAIVVMSVIVVTMGIDVRNVGSMGELTQTLPIFALPDIPLNFETLAIIFPYAMALTIVGLLESLLTASIVDDFTDTESDKNKESRGQGIANVVAGCFGGMAGCAMIGQSVINVKSGGRGRLSTLVAGVFLMFLIVVLGNVVVQIPMAALAGVMIMVSIGTFDWGSVRNIHKTPLSDAAVMVITVVTVVLTHNLAYGVLAGVVLSMIFFAVKISRVRVLSLYMNEAQKRIYYVQGQLFFASVTEFQESIEFNEIPSVKEVIIDLSESHLWDDSAIGALDSVEAKFDQKGIDVTFVGINAESRRLLEKVGGVSKTSS
ncbi:sodium-independent anion transporter [Salimicrobium jeotgali]|uniref:Sodium-independent anion transporter n=1 Tax=Salimicrobium jeotgali TaxID=1230341 RepID=K2GBS5_9BACI|nr:SulP family inorganic anion transporter [Salimicrobium jeotgali]AKG04765.1 sodium-independent anion transporter [Salimicrobium jeotgali]EKE31727.1 sulfate transporter family protein [Salimicrobium jeotgali]MBM7696313.1 SulP family sulfate permease [Salimicrobium jeotgali]